jgi:glutamyl-tRNA reductase
MDAPRPEEKIRNVHPPRRRAHLVLVGASHKSAPLSILESIALPPDRVREALPELRAQARLEEALLLSTCNRTEIYGTSADPTASAAELERWMIESARGGERLRPEHIFRRFERDAAGHLFRVGCGADSMMLGETQIAGQIQESLKLAQSAGTIGSYLVRLLAAAFRACKRARSRTGISTGVVSVASATAYLAQRVFGDLDRKEVLILGTGETGALAARHFRKRRPRVLRVANRTPEKAEALAADLGAEAILLEERARALIETDIVVAATRSPEPLVTREMVAEAMRHRASRALLLIDVSLPHNIERSAGDLENVFLHDMNDLRTIVDQSLSRRMKELPGVHQIVNKEVEGFFLKESAIEAGPLIAELRARFVEVRDRELERSLGRFREEDREAARRLAEDLTEKLLRGPIREIREASQRADGGAEPLLWVRRLFGLGSGSEEKE